MWKTYGTTLNDLKSVVLNHTATYQTALQFPLTLVNGGFKFYHGNIFDGFSKDGLTYLFYRLGITDQRARLRELYEDSPSTFVQEINTTWRALCQDGPKWHDRTLIGAFHKSTLWGLLTHYNEVSNLEVLELLETARLTSHVSFWEFTPKEMTVHLKNKFVGGLSFGLAVRNGETGHATLGYYLYAGQEEKGGYMLSVPMQTVKRHLSLVGSAVNNLLEAAKAAFGIDIENAMHTILVKDIRYLQTNEAVQWTNHIRDNAPVSELIMFLSKSRLTRGKKGECDKSLDAILTYIIRKVQGL